MCVCVCVCVCVCAHVYAHSIHVCACMFLCGYVHLSMGMFTYVCLHLLSCRWYAQLTVMIWYTTQTHSNWLSTKCIDLEQQLQRLQTLADKISSYEQQLEEAHKEMSQFKQQTDEKISQMETDHQNKLEVRTQG